MTRLTYAAAVPLRSATTFWLCQRRPRSTAAQGIAERREPVAGPCRRRGELGAERVPGAPVDQRGQIAFKCLRRQLRQQLERRGLSAARTDYRAIYDDGVDRQRLNAQQIVSASMRPGRLATSTTTCRP